MFDGPEDCDRIVAEVMAAFDAVHVLVNNAAISMAGPGEPVWRADQSETGGA